MRTRQRRPPATLEEVVPVLRVHLTDLRQRYHIKALGIFGSYVRGQERRGSDLDILVDFEEDARRSLFDFLGLREELTDLLGVKVDLVERRGLKPYIGRRILAEVVPLVEDGEILAFRETPMGGDGPLAREIRDFLNDILDNVAKVQRFCAGADYDRFASDEVRVYAVLHALLVIGEAARHIPPALRQRHRLVPWRKVVGLRNIVAHEYFAVYLPTVWEVIREDLPPLREAVAQMLEQPSHER